MAMCEPCCVGVIRDAKHLVGQDVTLKGPTENDAVPGYYMPASAISEMGIYNINTYICMFFVFQKRLICYYLDLFWGVVVIKDIFGDNIPNCKYIVDHLGNQGFHAVAPDNYFRKDPEAWQATEFEAKDLGGENQEEFGTFFGKLVTPEYQVQQFDTIYLSKCMTFFGCSFFWCNLCQKRLIHNDIQSSIDFLKQKGCKKVGVIGTHSTRIFSIVSHHFYCNYTQ